MANGGKKVGGNRNAPLEKINFVGKIIAAESGLALN